MSTNAKDFSPLEKKIAARIRENGPITFADFMEAALYDPEHGYYSRGGKKIGFAGDYFTSPTLSAAFGRILARLMPVVDDALDGPDKFHIVELGAGAGLTAIQVLDALQRNRPDLFARTTYYCVERIRGRRKAGGSGGPDDRVKWVKNLDDIEVVSGVVLANEFFDALPVHRVVMRSDGLREIMVAERNGKLRETEAEPSSSRIEQYFLEWGIELSAGQEAEVCLAAKDWIDRVAAILDGGLVVTIDYGWGARELYSPRRKRGTLLAYKSHEVVEDFLQNVGEQDLTAHVNFTALARWGRNRGLDPLAFTDQLRFFLELGIHEVFAEMEAESSSYTEYQVKVQPAKALIMPGGMGDTFKVLVQHKGLDECAAGTLRDIISSKYPYE